MSIETVVKKLDALGCSPTKNGDGWKACCPAHEDHTPSLSIDLGDDGRVLLNCFVGCPIDAIAKAAGLDWKELFPPLSSKPAAGTKGKSGFSNLTSAINWMAKKLGASVGGQWTYNPDFVVARFDLKDGPKQFKPFRHDPDGWRMKDPAGRLPLYHLDELATAPVVAILEGEKCTDLARGKLSLVATTSAHGSKSAKKSDWSVLAGKHVHIFPDNDRPGEKYANEVAAILLRLDPKPTVKIIKLPLVNEGDDLEQWLDNGGAIGQLNELTGAASVCDSSDSTALEPPKTSVGSGKSEPETHADILLRLSDSAALFHDDSGRAFATVPVDGHRETHEVLGSGFRRWLKRQFYSETNRPPSAQSFQDSLGVLEARAQIDGPVEQVFVRVAERDGRIYLDLGDDTWRAVEIDAKGWRLVDKPPVRFRRPSGLRPLPIPIKDGQIAKLKDFANLDDDDFLLLVAVLVAALRPTGPYPILVLTGEAGTAKSTLARIFRLLVDNHVMLLRSEPREPRDLVIGAVNNWVVAMDNISSVPAWLSDALCRLATGGGQATRTLYTNDEETFLDATRPVILTGITDFVSRGDLVDRCVFLPLPLITEDKRKTERDFWKDFHAESPKLLGALLDALAGGLRELPNTTLTSIPRMADFAVFGEAVSRGLGNDPDKFLNIYRDNRKAANESALEDSHVAAAIRELIAKVKWSGTTAELKDSLELIVPKHVAQSDRWPKSPRGMSGVLRRLAPSLRQVGIYVEFPDRKKKNRVISISLLENKGSQQAPQAQQAPSDGSDLSEQSCVGACSVPVGADLVFTVTQQAPQQAPTETIARNRLTTLGACGADGADHFPTHSNGHTENAREVLEI